MNNRRFEPKEFPFPHPPALSSLPSLPAPLVFHLQAEAESSQDSHRKVSHSSCDAHDTHPYTQAYTDALVHMNPDLPSLVQCHYKEM